MMSLDVSLYEARMNRTKWFMNARFGMFIHWGLYAITARGEWVRSVERISIEDYQKYFDEFNPTSYNPHEWARIAKSAGMKYAVMTAKHHDGFCLFDSKLTDYKATNTPAGRDLIGEYVDAFREEGLGVGLYYSLVDWHHPDYPVFGDRQHPMRDNEAYRGKEHNFHKYLDYMHGQIRELCENYGKIDILYLDFSYWDMKREAWKAEELVRMVRSLQPDILINNRLGGDIRLETPEIFAGDFANPEHGIPREPLTDECGRPIPWETIETLNDSWGYCSMDKNYRTPEFFIRALVNCVSKGGNLALNVGPDANGRIPEASVQILSEIGKWMEDNNASIYECGISGLEKPEWGRFTRKGKILYAHVLDQAMGHFSLKGLNGKIQKARLLSDGSEVLLTGFWNADARIDTFDGPDDIFFNFANPVFATYKLPDAHDTVIALYLSDQ
jgi:alpha-L-fucosidase